MDELDIAEVARRARLPASTLRYYEQKGLISSTGRHGLRRLFRSDVLERLALVALGRAAGFTLQEIAQMFAPDGQPRIDRQRLLDKAAAIDRTINELRVLRDGLRHAAACRAASHMQCPTFRRIVRAAASGAIGGRRPTARGRRSDVEAPTTQRTGRRR